MEPLSEELFSNIAEQYTIFEENVKSRVLYIVNYIAKKRGFKPCTSINIYEDHFNGLLMGKYHDDVIKIYHYDFIDTTIIWNNKEIRVPHQIPIVWLKWNFEDELEGGITEYNKKIKAQDYDEAYNKAKNRYKIIPEEVHQAEIDYIKELAAKL